MRSVYLERFVARASVHRWTKYVIVFDGVVELVIFYFQVVFVKRLICPRIAAQQAVRRHERTPNNSIILNRSLGKMGARW